MAALIETKPALKIGPYQVDPPVVLAPMAGITNVAFRQLCAEYGAGIYVCEMITARAVVERHPGTMHLMTFGSNEKPRSMQLYGVDPKTMSELSRSSSARASPTTSTATSAAQSQHTDNVTVQPTARLCQPFTGNHSPTRPMRVRAPTLYTIPMGTLSQWSQPLGALFLGLVGLRVAHSYRRQVKVKLAERLADSYSSLWELTRATSPTLLGLPSGQNLAEIDELMENWYFENGNGLLMSKSSRILFFHIKTNLTTPPSTLVPESLSRHTSKLDAEKAKSARSCACDRQMSILRTQLKDDLAIYRGTSHQRHRRKDERDLLSMCKISCGPLPFRRIKNSTPCQCGMCPNAYSWPDRIADIRSAARSNLASVAI